MATVNHLKNKEQQRKSLVWATGKQAATGYCAWSKVDGAAPNHQITAFNPLGVGEWNACLGAFFKGEEIPASDYEFRPGAHATGFTTGAQQVCSYFPKDVPHSHTVGIGYKAPFGLGSADNLNNPPKDFKGIFETTKSYDFDGKGDLVDYGYSANPARCILEAIRSYGRLPNLPSVWADYVAYWISRIDFGNLVEFRDFHTQTETVDYRTWDAGFGLRARYYSGTNFNTFVTRFIHPNFDINYNSEPPAAGISAGNFSAKYDGYIKFPYSETYTIYITHDNGARLWLNGSQLMNIWQDDGDSPFGTNSVTFNATADAFVAIEMHWNDGGSPSNFKVEWESASQTREVVPSKYLYAPVEQQELYESHIYIESPSSIAATIREILRVSNSFMTDVNGKLRFFCYEQLTPSFTLDASNIEKFEFRRRDILRRDPFTEYEGEFKDLDSQYLQEPSVPVSVKLDIYARKTFENVKVVPLYSNTRWRIKKLLDTQAALELGNDLLADAETLMAKTYPITAGDLVSVTHRKVGASARNFLVRKTADAGVAESSDTQSDKLETRNLVLQEWGGE